MSGVLAKFVKHPVARASLTSGTVMFAGDCVCQVIQHANRPNPPKLDLRRAARFGFLGLTLHGPFFFHGYRSIDRYFGSAQTIGTALRKTAAGQATIFPVYITLFYGYMGLLEGKSPAQCMRKVQESYLPTFLGGSIFWPIANMFNFIYVASNQRVMFAAGAGLIWNAFLSWTNTRYGQIGSTETLTAQ